MNLLESFFLKMFIFKVSNNLGSSKSKRSYLKYDRVKGIKVPLNYDKYYKSLESKENIKQKKQPANTYNFSSPPTLGKTGQSS